MTKAKLTQPSARPVLSVFYRGSKVVKTNHAAYPNNAVVNAIKHMQINEYSATHVEVFCAESGKLYVVIKRSIKMLVIAYKAEIEGRLEDSK